MADRIELTLRPKADVKPFDLETAERIGRVARADTVELRDGDQDRFLGKGVRRAVESVEEQIGPALTTRKRPRSASKGW